MDFAKIIKFWAPRSCPKTFQSMPNGNNTILYSLFPVIVLFSILLFVRQKLIESHMLVQKIDGEMSYIFEVYQRTISNKLLFIDQSIKLLSLSTGVAKHSYLRMEVSGPYHYHPPHSLMLSHSYFTHPHIQEDKHAHWYLVTISGAD